MIYGTLPCLGYHLGSLGSLLAPASNGVPPDRNFFDVYPFVGGVVRLQARLKYRLFYPHYRSCQCTSPMQRYLTLLRVADLTIKFLRVRSRDPPCAMRPFLGADEGSQILYCYIHTY